MTRSITRQSGITAAITVFLVLGILTPVWTQGQSTIAIGPYVQNVGTDNATICWATVSGEVTVNPPAGHDSIVREYQTHSVKLRDLEPGTTYTYNLQGDAGDTSRCTFTTVPEGEHPFSFAVVSDTQNRGNPAHRPIVERIMAGNPDMVFNAGDLVSDGRDIGDWEEFFRVNHDLMCSVPYYPALGNHDRASDLYFQFFVLPGNERYYSFDRGAAHFVVFDSPGLYLPEDNQSRTAEDERRHEERDERYWQRQMQWLRDDLAKHQDAKYIFVFFHFPPYSVKASRVEGSKELRTRFGSVFQDHKVTAVFSGHDHHYHHAVAGGVHFLEGGVAGGGARPIDAPPLPETVKAESVVCFMRVDVGAEQADVRIIDVAGNTVDEFELSARPQPATAAN
ncbi:MAG: metallophosphoesterase family protein [Armatimonadota bacterium]|nr:MAG: metallophosphoesterase family protein [Armatimonadota bacterium]